MGQFSSQTCILQESTPKTNSAPFGHGNLGFFLTNHGLIMKSRLKVKLGTRYKAHADKNSMPNLHGGIFLTPPCN